MIMEAYAGYGGDAACATSPRVRGEVDLRAKLLRSEASRVRGHFHRLKLAATPPHPDSCASLGIRPRIKSGAGSLPARGERCSCRTAVPTAAPLNSLPLSR